MAASSSSPIQSLLPNSIPTKTKTCDHPLTLKYSFITRRTWSPRATIKSVAKIADKSLVEESVNTIRFLAVDAVEKANSDHPRLPIDCAPMGHVLFDEVMKYNQKNPYWFNRDRFVLSAGHGCMLHYALLYLAGYDSVKEDNHGI